MMQNVKAVFFWPLTTRTESVDFWLYGKKKNAQKLIWDNTQKSEALRLFVWIQARAFLWSHVCVGYLQELSGTPASSHIPNTCVRLGQLVILTWPGWVHPGQVSVFWLKSAPAPSETPDCIDGRSCMDYEHKWALFADKWIHFKNMFS